MAAPEEEDVGAGAAQDYLGGALRDRAGEDVPEVFRRYPAGLVVDYRAGTEVLSARGDVHVGAQVVLQDEDNMVVVVAKAFQHPVLGQGIGLVPIVVAAGRRSYHHRKLILKGRIREIDRLLVVHILNLAGGPVPEVAAGIVA